MGEIGPPTATGKEDEFPFERGAVGRAPEKGEAILQMRAVGAEAQTGHARRGGVKMLSVGNRAFRSGGFVPP